MFRRKSRDRALALRLLTSALVEIRAEANVGDPERARRLADAFHNAPVQLIRGRPVEVIADVKARCERSGEGEWFQDALQTVAI